MKYSSTLIKKKGDISDHSFCTQKEVFGFWEEVEEHSGNSATSFFSDPIP